MNVRPRFRGRLRSGQGASSASGTLAETYLRTRGITVPIPISLRHIAERGNWVTKTKHPALVSLVERIAGDEDRSNGSTIRSGVHLTFLSVDDTGSGVCKAKEEPNKLTLGQLRHGGVWLTPVDDIGSEMAVAEGLETALSVVQLTGLPTVAALSAVGMQALRWPPGVRKIWIAADADDVGQRAAEHLCRRARGAGLAATIRRPKRPHNDFNDLLLGVQHVG